MSDGVQHGTVLPGGGTVGDLIAEGRLCTVYSARLPTGEEAVARVLRADLAGDLTEWFLATARTRLALDHPVLPKIFAFGYAQGLPVEVTERITGRTAQDLLDQGQNGLDVPTAMRMVRSIAAALDHLHATTPPTLHRALLPEHVMVRERDGAVLLLAVGEADRPRIAVTRPAYLSPEELADVSSLSPRADVFSLATLTYELLTGRPAFVGGGDVVLDTVRMARFPRLREHRPDIHARAEHILREAWALSPEDRPTTAGRFASLLAEAVNQQAQTLVNVPTAQRAEAPPSKSTLNGPGPLDLAARKAIQEVRGAVAPTSEASAPPAVLPTRTPVSNARAPRGGRTPSQRPRSFLPKPGDATDDATRPEILVPSAVRGGEQAASDATPVDGTASPPTPRFSKTTPGVPSPMPSKPAPITSATIPDTISPFADVASTPSVTPATRASSDVPRSPEAPSVPVASSAPSAPPPPQLSPEALPQGDGTPRAPSPGDRPPAQSSAPVATQQPSPPPMSAAPAATAGPLSGSPFEPQQVPSQAPSQGQVTLPPPPRDDQAPWPRPSDEDTQVFSTPSTQGPPPRSPLVIAAALIANAIVIVGIAHAIAWAQLHRAPPTVVQAPAPVCAPCAACPPQPVCPPSIAQEPAPGAPSTTVRPPGAAPPRTQPVPRPTRAPTIVRTLPTFR